MPVVICMRNIAAGIVLISLAVYLFLFISRLPVSDEIKMYIISQRIVCASMSIMKMFDCCLNLLQKWFNIQGGAE